MKSSTEEQEQQEPPNVVCLRGQIEADWFAELFKRNAALVHRYVYRRTEPHNVEDIVAETFATAWRKHNEIPRDFELAWLYKTAGYIVANHNRKIQATLLEDFPEIAGDHDPAAIVVEDQTLRKAFYRLSERDRKVIILAAWEGQSSDEIAVALGMSANAAAVALSRARARFSKTYETENAEPSQADREA